MRIPLAAALVTALLAGSAAAAEPASPPASPGMSPPRSALDPHGPARVRLAPLRRFHEGALFAYQRYAMLDALLGAVRRGRPENEAFWIGTASLAVPGAGQFLNDDPLQGGLLLAGGVFSWATVNRLAFTRPRPAAGGPVWAYFGTAGLRDALMSYAMMHAANARFRADRDRSAAMWTGAASMVPGVGQAINGDWWEAAGFFAAWAGTALAAAALEERVYPDGSPASFVRRRETPAWRLAWLPGGAAVIHTTRW